ncbi:MAG: formyltransferase family protein, partial [Nitrososphaerales archaeon]
IHPAYDLKRFGGKNMVGRKVHELALNSGAKYSGCTIHFVTNDLDLGPIVLKRWTEIIPGDSPETLEKKILRLEHVAYPEAIQLVSDERVVVDEKENRCYVDRYSNSWDIDWESKQQKYVEYAKREEER